MKYPECVVKNEIEIDTEEIDGVRFRYSLSIPLANKSQQIALVIMMNPAEADKSKSDSTITRVINYIDKNTNECGRLIIGNLYPVYEQKSELLSLHPEQVTKNHEVLTDLIDVADVIYLGWGKPNNKNENDLKKIKYHEVALNVIKLISEKGSPCFVRGIRDQLYPMHFGRIGYDEKMINCDLIQLKDELTKKLGLKQ